MCVEKPVEKRKKEKSMENKVPSKKKLVILSATKKSEDTSVTENLCNLIENQENRVNCANRENYNNDNTKNPSEVASKETDCQNGTNTE